jgi:hypothetical protein
MKRLVLLFVLVSFALASGLPLTEAASARPAAAAKAKHTKKRAAKKSSRKAPRRAPTAPRTS